MTSGWSDRRRESWKDQLNLNEMEGNDRGECGEVTGGETQRAGSHGMSRGKRRWARLRRRRRRDAGRRGELCPILSMDHFSVHSTLSLTLGLREGIVCKVPTRPLPQPKHQASGVVWSHVLLLW